MNKVFIIIAWLFFIPIHLQAQNLVPNASFENKNNCPTGCTGGAMNMGSCTTNTYPTVLDWVSAEFTTPDYFNTCAPTFSTNGCPVNIPNTFWGHQQPRTGNAFTGLYIWTARGSGGYCEYIECQLTQPLVNGHKYCFSMYVNPAYNTGFASINHVVGIDKIGINLSDTQVCNSSGPFVMSLPYSVVNTPGNYISDTAKWQEVSGVYTAHGGERYMTIGYFSSTGTAPTSYVSIGANNGNIISYVFIDDVSLIEIVDDTIIHDTTVCDGNPITLTASIHSAKKLWSTGDTSSQISINSTGIYWCTASTQCSKVIDTFKVKYIGVNSFSLGNDTTVCKQSLILLVPIDSCSYLWQDGSTSKVYTVTQSGTYNVTVNKDNCIIRDTINIILDTNNLSQQLKDTIICNQQDIQLRLDANAPTGTKILWSNGSSSSYIFVMNPGIYWVTVTDSICFGTDTMTLSIYNLPQMLKDTSVCLEQFQQMELHANVPLGYQVLWSTGSENPDITIKDEDKYWVTVTDGICISSDTMILNTEYCDKCNVFFPNVFSPNSDGKNDRFHPIIPASCLINSYELSIYNRWGQCVFKSRNPTESWDGNFKGKTADVGDYGYMLQLLEGVKKLRRLYKGEVILMR